jgi:hypothetical protein
MTQSTGNLSILAGGRALARLRRDGFSPDAVRVVAGAAGGPKWLILSQLDRVVFGELFKDRKDPLYLLGSSIGTWRFAAGMQRDPAAAIARFEDAYLTQRYGPKPTPREVSDTSQDVLERYVDDAAVDDILSHPTHRLSVVTVRARWPLTRDHKLALGFGLGGAMLANAVHRSGMHLFFQRTVLFDARSRPPFLSARGFESVEVPLSRDNLRRAILASGSIPMVMAGVDGIPDAPPGVYRDGGVMDYHLDVPFLDRSADELVLFPHFGTQIIPGWFDKSLPWRKATASRMDPVILLAPSKKFIASLPHGKIPDRKDFWLFARRDDERVAYWRAVLDACKRMADELREILRTGRLPELAQPLLPTERTS